jgi:hypothetical protein
VKNNDDIAALKLRESDATTVERDDRLPSDREASPAAVELAEHEKPRQLHPDDEAAVDCFRSR